MKKNEKEKKKEKEEGLKIDTIEERSACVINFHLV